ncbi:hypothetical protein XA68_18571 [Ophiocordyceps unilateralis]|uniref:Uncharacterized protein n=1 Tax=Ophiocordyceps unilateralis TaxID=268505 RepID=A0A2A9P377_OPHUN|nr:hypothetical protein XA68_18571 [Ophiocordyceps unilateralis]
MAHLHSLEGQPAVIFSPSVARIAASTARDWSYVDAWLASKLPACRPIPPFERNQRTLKALLTLALANEAADEERNNLAGASAFALRALEQHESACPLRDSLLASVQRCVSNEGYNALEALANVALQAAAPWAAPTDLGRDFVRLQASLAEMDTIISRLDLLRRHVDRDAGIAADALRAWQSHRSRPFPDAARQNLEMQRKTKVMRAQLVELLDRAARPVCKPRLTVEDISCEEQHVVALLARCRELEAHITARIGLPADTTEAEDEVEAHRSQLGHLELHRDVVVDITARHRGPA